MLKRLRKAREPRPLSLSPLHMDVHAGNLVHSASGLKLIDWEYAGDGDIALELAAVWVENTEQHRQLVNDYATRAKIYPYLCCDPVRPYVSAALPHAVRRFEFMVMPGETEEQLREPQNMRKLLSKVLPNPDNVELIRQRVYTHTARLAQRFRIDRVLQNRVKDQIAQRAT